MTDPLTDRALDIMAGAACVAMPVRELARHLGHGDPFTLGRRLEADGRFVVLRTTPFPAVQPDPLGRDDAYRAALRAAGLWGEPVVARSGVSAGPGTTIEAVLRDSIGRLLSSGIEPSLVLAAMLAQEAVAAVTPSDSGALSTIPFPDLRPPRKGPPLPPPPTQDRPPRS